MTDIFDDGLGILGTHVTWELVESSLQRGLKIGARFGANRSAQSIADGVGYSSIIALVDADWIGDEKAIAELPKRFIVKIASLIQGKRVRDEKLLETPLDEGDEYLREWAKLIRGIHNTECEVFDQINEAKNTEHLSLPKVWFTKKFSSPSDNVGFIIMEYLEEVKHYHLHDNLGIDQLKQVIREITKIQAFFINEKIVYGEDLRQRSAQKFYAHLLPKEKFKMIFVGLKHLGVDRLTELADGMLGKFDEIYDLNRLDALHHPEKSGMSGVLCHGDMWATNFLFDKKTDDLRFLIDFQMAHLGNPIDDLLRAFILGLSGEMRRKYEQELLEFYHSCLNSQLRDSESPFSIEQLKSEYRAYFPLAALCNTVMLGPVLMFSMNQIKDEAQKGEMMTKVFEKMIAIYEDALEISGN
ncbi:unnamed protein product, partial [Mesorhabditis belari]|uniref:CHK kinase-like domain-containing protein n=1 Tax=Mesorhabditis belari TaxID=2138241 RepID=A0AAF3F9B9_9BILA